MPDKKPLVLGPDGIEQLQSGDALSTGTSPYLSQADIVNNLTTNDPLKPLSAAQGKLLFDTAEQLDFEKVADEDAMIVDAAAVSDSTNKRYIVSSNSTQNGNTTTYLCTANVDPGETLFSNNTAKFNLLQTLDVQILETELSAVLTSTATNIALNLLGAKTLQDQIDSIVGGGAGVTPRTEHIEITQDVLDDGYFLVDYIPVNYQHPLIFMDQGSAQTGKDQVSVKSGSPSIDFQFDSVVKRRCYIMNKSADHDGNSTVEHSGLSESFVVNQVLLVFFMHTGQQ